MHGSRKDTENPELAVLRTLRTNLCVAELALLAVYPAGSEPTSPKHHFGAQEAYASAILHQIDALEATLDEYVESVRRARDWRTRESLEEDIPI
jgi:hypothetical protein